MRMNRRNVLLGLGAIVAGGGATLGTGAFSSVSAQRSATIQTAGDASAFLGIEAHPSRSSTGNPNDPDDSSDGTPYLTLDDTDKTLEFNFDGSGTPTIDGGGLNRNATTEFDDLIVISNQGQNAVTLNITLVDSNGNTATEDSAFSAYASANSTSGSISNGDPIDGTASLPAGESVDVGFSFDLTAVSSGMQTSYGSNVSAIEITATSA